MTTSQPIPAVTKTGIFDMQVCVPDTYTDDQITAFANETNPAGTMHGWFIRKQGDEALAGADEKVKCAERLGCVHVMLDC